MAAGSANPNFPFTGRWYDYLSGDSLEVSNKNGAIALPAGAYKVFTSKRVVHPYYWKSANTSTIRDISVAGIRCYPNPAKDILFVEGLSGQFQVTLYELSGKCLLQENGQSGRTHVSLKGLKPGMYLLKLSGESGVYSSRLLLE
jgi:hypothetical protein